MEANLLPCNAAARLQARARFSRFLFERKWGMTYGADHRVLRAQQLQKAGNEFVTAGTTWEGDPVRLTKEEVGLSPHA